MRDQEIVGLSEAYRLVCENDQVNREIEIVAEYFYEMGLNEDGVNILIEELGEEEFVDWVNEISEEYDLNEARAGGVKIKPVTKTGKSVASLRGGAKESAIKRLRKEKQARKESEASASSGGSGFKSFSQRHSAASSAASKQKKTSSSPEKTKKGIAGRIGSAVGSAVKRAKSDIELTKKTAQTVGKAVKTGIDALNTASDSRLAKQARVATKKGFRRQQKAIDTLAPKVGKAAGRAAANVSAIRDTYKAGKKLGRALRGEEYDYIISYLLDEGYATTLESAEVIAMNMGSDWIDEVLDEGFKPTFYNSGR